MATKKNKGIAVVAGVMILGALAYIGYTLFGKKKPTGDSNGGLKDELDALKDQVANLGSGGSGGSGSSGGSGGSSVSTDQPDDILAFQKWVINVKGDKTILGTGGESGFGDDGLWGSKTSAAWSKYKSAYLSDTTKPTSTDQPELLQSVFKNLVEKYKKVATFGANTAGTKYMGVKSDQHDLKYWWFANGNMYVDDTKANKTIARGTYTSGGKTITGQSVNGDKGVAGKKFTADTPTAAAYYLSQWVDPSSKLTYSDASIYKMIAQNIKGATKGGGTYDGILWQNLHKLKTRADFEKVMPMSLGGYTIWKWIKGDLQDTTEQKHWNWYLQRFVNSKGQTVSGSYYFLDDKNKPRPAVANSVLSSYMV